MKKSFLLAILCLAACGAAPEAVETALASDALSSGPGGPAAQSCDIYYDCVECSPYMYTNMYYRVCEDGSTEVIYFGACGSELCF